MNSNNKLFLFVLTLGAFGIINTEMGVIGILPYIANHFHTSVATAGLLVSIFALTVAISGPTTPLLFSGINRKKIMLIVLSIFVVGNLIALFTTNYSIALIARIIPALVHPLYFSSAFTLAAHSVQKKDAPRAVSKVFIGVSAGMVLGVPIASFLASTFSLQVSMSFFALVNIIVLICTWVFFPSMPVTKKASYSTQLNILKKPIVWHSIFAVVLFNAAIFGVYSFLAEYLKSVTHISGQLIGFLLFIFGGANILGNTIAGSILIKSPLKTVIMFPFALGFVYILLFLIGSFTLPMAIITFIWGIVAGIGTNINQYWISSAAPEAPDFANGLFLSAVNLGTTLGTFVGGLFISSLGTPYIVFVGILSLAVSTLFITFRMKHHRLVT
ncbi:major facilitator family transporter [Fictibacillus macauensis ZFHKF-1]|uniref:Major facilitator family transporter n=1 Tax=Fictibacillus macauensis ZFHKF-1 TaxID=1196324 RepID=I8ALS0_9BACL|nr:MFS transporter [Fictibacillus macauensis]EIT86872.1 major facilitator family transporter [Fictibacillus macauensis ZFHKF-1]